MKNTKNITHAALIGAMYFALTHLQNLLVPNSATWVIQFRASEALCVLALFTPAAVPGLTIGCLLVQRPAGGLGADHLPGRDHLHDGRLLDQRPVCGHRRAGGAVHPGLAPLPDHDENRHGQTDLRLIRSHPQRKACVGGVFLGKIYFVKCSFVSLMTTGLRPSRATRLGTAMKPLRVSAMFQTRPSFRVAPTRITQTKMT